MSGIMMLLVGGAAALPPVNTVAPVVSGTVGVGNTLSTNNGTWTGDAPITYTYQWQRSGSNIGGATSSTYVIQAADVGYTLRCVVTGTNSVGNSSANSNSTATVPPVTGQVEYTSPGTYTFVVPAGVTSISVLGIGAGGGGNGSTSGCAGGGGGALGYANNVSVTPGDSHTIIVGDVGAGVSSQYAYAGGAVYFKVNGVSDALIVNGGAGASAKMGGAGGQVYGYAGWTIVGNTGGAGARINDYTQPGGGGGAAGYSGTGGQGGSLYNYPSGMATDGSGGGGGGGAAAYQPANIPPGNGGGVGRFGQGSNGAAGPGWAGADGSAGSGGSGQTYGGGGGGGWIGSDGTNYSGRNGGPGMCRILWPGNTRYYPSTNTGNM